MNKGEFEERILPAIKGFLEGFFKMSATNIIRKEAFDINDNFILLVFGDLLGIPNPTSYYMLELLPLLAEELEGWERRMLGRKSIIAEKIGQYDFCC